MKSMTCVVIAAILVVLSSTGHASSVPIISGHGINFAVGNKYQSETDIILDGPVNGLAFRRTYNSQSAENGAMGYGWSHSFSERLVDTSLSITLVKHDGQRVRFPYDAYGNYTTNLGSPQTIVRLSGGGYQLIQADRATRTYDAQGRLTAITQRNGTGITCTWTGAQLSAVTDTLGRMLTFTYANNKLTGVATPAGNFTFTYDSNSNLIRVTRPDGTFRVYEYTDARDIHNLTGIVDEAGIRIQTITYDSSDRVVGSTLADGKDKVTIAYLSAQTRVITDALGNVSTYTLTSLNGMLRVQSMSGSGCSGCGSGTGVSFVYDDWLRPVSSTDANGTVTAYTYAANGSRLTEVEASGMPLARTTTYTYTSQNQVATITRPSASAPVQNQVTNMTYDAKGQRIREDVRDPEGILTYTIGLAYDANGNLVSRTWADNARETSAYDAVRNLVQSIDSTGMQTDSSYDALRRLLGVAEAGTAIAVYTYDRRDNPASVTDARGHVTRFTYDDLGNRLSVESPDAGITRMSYDPAGNLLRAVDAMGHTVSSQYDALNRPIKQSFFNAGDILFTYDQGANAIGKLSKITDQDGSNTFTYDAAGRIATETRIISGMSHTVGYSWDAATGELAGITYPSGLALTYSRDANGRISAIAADGTSIVSAVSRLPFGPVKAARLASTNLTRTYDQRYSVSAIKAGGADFGFSRDAGGNVTGITGVQAPTLTAETIDYSYNAANNQITAAPPKNYTYDANGNMASDGTLGFMYDGLNRLIQVSQGTSPIASYGYDANNRRIRKSTGGVTSHYLYDINNNLIAETLLDGTPLREYIYLDGEPIAVKEYQSIPGIYYFINDHLGTPQQLVDASGTVVWQAAYLPFGQAQVTTVTARNNLRFPGQYFDAETGLHYNLNRYYDSDTGRYISGDPIGLVGGMNLYAYVEGNPVNWFDPSGLFQFGIRSLNGFRPQIPLPNNVSTWHENGFYDNGSNSGYFPTGIGPDLSHDKNAYSMFGPYYDDSIIAKAEQSLRESNKWSPGDYSLKSHNCQDYADALRDKYKKLGGHTCSQPFTTGGWAGCFAIPGN